VVSATWQLCSLQHKSRVILIACYSGNWAWLWAGEERGASPYFSSRRYGCSGLLGDPGARGDPGACRGDMGACRGDIGVSDAGGKRGEGGRGGTGDVGVLLIAAILSFTIYSAPYGPLAAKHAHTLGATLPRAPWLHGPRVLAL
jgi:hypothetical protein